MYGWHAVRRRRRRAGRRGVRRVPPDLAQAQAAQAHAADVHPAPPRRAQPSAAASTPSWPSTKESWTAGDTITVERRPRRHPRSAGVFRAGSFDAVVTDAPYGVQHGSRSRRRARGAARSTCWRAAAPGWVEAAQARAERWAWPSTCAPARARGRSRCCSDAGLEPLDSGPVPRLRAPGRPGDRPRHRGGQEASGGRADGD